MSFKRVLSILAFASLLPAQSPRGTITGTVTDPQEGRIPNVEIIATNTGTNLTFKATAAADGTYSIPNLPVGRYNLSAKSQGFKTWNRTDLVLEVSARLRVDIVLEVGALSEAVTVTGEAPRVQTEDSTLGTVVERQRIDQLPFGRGLRCRTC